MTPPTISREICCLHQPFALKTAMMQGCDTMESCRVFQDLAAHGYEAHLH